MTVVPWVDQREEPREQHVLRQRGQWACSKMKHQQSCIAEARVEEGSGQRWSKEARLRPGVTFAGCANLILMAATVPCLRYILIYSDWRRFILHKTF